MGSPPWLKGSTIFSSPDEEKEQSLPRNPEYELDDIYDSGEEKLTKSKVIHVRVDPELYRHLRKAALAVDKKPCDWIRRAIMRAIAAEKAERKATPK